MIVIPAIDVRARKAIGLGQGDPNGETAFADDPVALAKRFQEEGARRLHVMDLDDELEEGENGPVIEAVCRTVQVPVQVGGGIRTLEQIDRVLALGASRAVLDSAGALDASFVRRAVEEHAEAIVVSVDVRADRVMVRGGTEDGPPLDSALAALDEAGAPRFLVTSIARGGTRKGPDLTLYERVLAHTDTPVIASGGVRDADDVWALRDVGCEAVVTRKALYERTLKLSQVIRG